jgi:phage shock protein C
MSEVKRLLRSQENQMLGGVAAGLGQYFGLDPLLIRAAFVALALLNGMGFFLYLILWVIIPSSQTASLSSEKATQAHFNEIAARISSVGKSLGEGRGATLAGLALVVLGALFLLRQFVPFIDLALFWPLILIGLGLLILIRR